MARDAEEFGALVAFASEAGEPVTAATCDRRSDRDSLDICDGRRAAKETDVGRERRLQPRLALLALNRLDEGRLLAADVGARTAVEVDVKGVTGAAGVLT